MEVLSTVKDVFSIITPFALLLLGWWWTVRQKKVQTRTDEQRALYMKELEIRDAKRDEAISRLDAAVETLSATQTKIKEVKDSVDALDHRLDTLQGKVEQTATLNKLNGRYTNEVAVLVTALAEGLRDEHMDGNITAAVNRYQSFESRTLGLFISGEALDPDQ